MLDSLDLAVVNDEASCGKANESLRPAHSPRTMRERIMSYRDHRLLCQSVLCSFSQCDRNRRQWCTHVEQNWREQVRNDFNREIISRVIPVMTDTVNYIVRIVVITTLYYVLICVFKEIRRYLTEGDLSTFWITWDCFDSETIIIGECYVKYLCGWHTFRNTPLILTQSNRCY